MGIKSAVGDMGFWHELAERISITAATSEEARTERPPETVETGTARDDAAGDLPVLE